MPPNSTVSRNKLNKTQLVFCQVLLFLHQKKSPLTKRFFRFLLYLFAISQFVPNILLDAVTGEAKFGGGTNVLHSDGSFELADGNLQ